MVRVVAATSYIGLLTVSSFLGMVAATDRKLGIPSLQLEGRNATKLLTLDNSQLSLSMDRHSPLMVIMYPTDSMSTTPQETSSQIISEVQ